MYYIIDWPAPLGMENIIRASEPVIPVDAQFQPLDIFAFDKLKTAKKHIYEYFNDPEKEIIIKL